MNRTSWIRSLQKGKITLQGLGVLFLSGILLLFGANSSQTKVDLKKAGHITGKILSVKRTNKRTLLDDLVIMLQNREQKYLLFRLSQNYESLRSKLKTETPVSIYYDPDPIASSRNEFMIYQLEALGSVLISKAEYEQKERNCAHYLLIPGGLFLLLAGGREVIKRYRKLTRAVNERNGYLIELDDYN